MPAPCDRPADARPILVLAHTDALYAELVHRTFVRWGWRVCRAASGPDARAWAARLSPSLVVLDTDLPGESGWLTSDKLSRDLPGTRVILITDRPTGKKERFATFVGAVALVGRQGSLQALLGEARETMLPAVG